MKFQPNSSLDNNPARNTNSIYDIPFSLEKKLRVFKGKLNGIETDFAFDTGAAEGIATINDEKRNGIERKKVAKGKNKKLALIAVCNQLF